MIIPLPSGLLDEIVDRAPEMLREAGYLDKVVIATMHDGPGNGVFDFVVIVNRVLLIPCSREQAKKVLVWKVST